jgi:heme/copper-type cytochrome/quinol oxidase subunit 1
MVTFFPMHIVGLLGMTRRVYTYEAGLGWGIYNLIETVGGFVLAFGILLIFTNLLWSARRGPATGADPFFGGTLEWTIPSPPPAYNFAVIPRVRSAYPNWDRADRDADLAQLRRDEPSLPDGHLTPASSVLDGMAEAVLEMPSESFWPILTALSVTAVFALLLTSHFIGAGLVALIVLAVLAGWHSDEPEPAA